MARPRAIFRMQNGTARGLAKIIDYYADVRNKR
jgi:hypothetical protein